VAWGDADTPKGWGTVHANQDEYCLTMDGHRVAAYMVESRASTKPGLLEAGGTAAAIGILVGSVLANCGLGQFIDLHPGFAPPWRSVSV